VTLVVAGQDALTSSAGRTRCKWHTSSIGAWAEARSGTIPITPLRFAGSIMTVSMEEPESTSCVGSWCRC
jgi:hypothetical protein